MHYKSGRKASGLSVDFPVRIDLHCHSVASCEAGEAVLNAIKCPESYSEPTDVYDQARRRGMTFVALTDHDTIVGAKSLLPRTDILVGEELTCYFPEDKCKMHVLVWGLDDRHHNELQARASDIYEVAAYVESNRLAHSVAHPVYRQNDRLERWHIERLILLFKGFECLNGAHSNLHRESFEPVLDELDEARIDTLSRRHRLRPHWEAPAVKARTGGSDDHGLFNIGRTWTEFPDDVHTPAEALDALREGRCRPGGEAGSSIKLAHNFYSVGIKYYSRQLLPADAKPTYPTLMLNKLVGENRTFRKRDLAWMVAKDKLKGVGRTIAKPFVRRQPGKTGASLMLDLFSQSFSKHLGSSEQLTKALAGGLAPLGEHDAMFDLVGKLNRDLAQGVADAVDRSLKRGNLSGLFDALSSVASHQFVLMPYYFALFHQNRERHLLRRITGHGKTLDTTNMRLGVFTDTFDEINGVARFVQDMSHQAHLKDKHLVIHTCTTDPKVQASNRKNFTPMVSRPMPCYPELQLNIPPLVEMLEWADRQQFDAIHVHTPGAVGLCGWLVAKMLKIPLLGTYHTDFPAYIDSFTGDHRLTVATEAYMKWFYGQTTTIFSRSREYQGAIAKLGISGKKMPMLPAATDTEKFNPRHRDSTFWPKLRVSQKFKLFYAGRVSTEKNLPLMTEAFKRLCKQRSDVALVIAGEGPYFAQMKKELAGLPAYFLGYQNDVGLMPLYANADLFVFPSRTDTLGQVVIEAQASGLPVLVSDEGGPKEVMDDGITGRVLPAVDPKVWADAIDDLLNDDQARGRMSRSAPTRVSRFSLSKTFDVFWDEHLQAAAANIAEFEEQPEFAAKARNEGEELVPV